VKVEGDLVVIGITFHAQDSMMDIVYIQLPDEGDSMEKGDPFGEIESVKSVEELYAPVSGKVVKVHDELIDEPGVINNDPYGEGWMIKVEPVNMSDVDGLMDAGAYDSFVAQEKE